MPLPLYARRSTFVTVLALCLAAFSSCNHRAGARAKIPSPIALLDYTENQYKLDRSAYLNSPAASDDRRTRRNMIVLECMRAIDLRYEQMVQDLTEQRSGSGLAFDIASLAGAGLGTVVNGARGKTIISAVLGGVVGSKISIDKNWFQEKSANAIIASMRSGRSRIKDTIINSLGKADTNYPLPLAESAVLDYYLAGTLTGGLQELHDQSAQEARANEVVEKKSIVLLNTVSVEERELAVQFRAWIVKQRASPDPAAIASVYLALVKAKFAKAGAETDMQKLDAINITFQQSIQQSSGITPSSLFEATANLIK